VSLMVRTNARPSIVTLTRNRVRTVGAVYDRAFVLDTRRNTRGHRPRLQFTISNLANPMAAFSSAFLQKSHRAEGDSFFGRFAHVVHRECGHGSGGHSLPLHA